jgi:hypothetical protein
MSHRCPGPDCEAQVPDHMLMCRTHWYQVPRSLRNAVWKAWRDGAGSGTAEHTQAITLAIRSIGGRG